MKQYLPLLANCALMDGIPSGSIPGLLACLETQLINCKKGNVILQQDDPARLFGVVLSGNVQVLRGNVQGSHAIIASLGPGELFGETFACAALPALPVNVIATASSTVLLFLHDRVICGCKQGCQSHSRLVTNLLRITAQKNLLLSRKLEIVMQRTTSDKLMAYLRFQAEMAHSSRFSIPFDRQQLADYLGVERSAMSTELNKLKKAGLIDFSKNEFILHS